jgi:hypothetical protein
MPTDRVVARTISFSLVASNFGPVLIQENKACSNGMESTDFWVENHSMSGSTPK